MNLKVEPFIVKRNSGGGYVNGRWVPGADTALIGRGNIQPLSGSELMQLPEGDREKDVQKIYTELELLNGDKLIRDKTGIAYEVQAVKDYTAFKQPHYKARLVRLEEQ